MKVRKYTKEDFISAVLVSTSLKQVLERLNISGCGGNYQTAKKFIKYLCLDISHFKGQGWRRDTIIGPKRPIEDYLNNKFTIKSHNLRLRLIKEGYFQHKCCMCALEEWLGNPIPLELHHVDGNNLNNNLSNLTIICPNCHTLTPNYRGKNK